MKISNRWKVVMHEKRLTSFSSGISAIAVILIIVVVLIVLGTMGKTRRKSQPITYPPPTKTQTPTQTQTVYPTNLNQQSNQVSPKAPGSGAIFPVEISEDQINSEFNKSLVSKTQGSDNPITSAVLRLQEGLGSFEARFQQGQIVSAQIVVTPEGNNLAVENVQVTGAGILDAVYKRIAQDSLNSIVNIFILSQQGKKLQQIQIQPGKLVLYYQLF